MHLEEIKSLQITFACGKKTTTKNPTVFSPEAEGMAMVKRKKKIETDLPKLLSLTDSPQRAIFWHCIMRNEALERESHGQLSNCYVLLFLYSVLSLTSATISAM